MAGRRSASSWFFLNAIPATIVMVLWLAVLWAIEGVNYLSKGHDQLSSQYGIRPRDLGDIQDIYTAPFFHGSWDHLIGNSLPLLIFGFLVALRGLVKLLAVTFTVATVSGLGVWFISPSNSVTFGASGVIMGLLAFLLVRGIFDRKLWDIALGLGIFAVYGTLLWGVLPQQQGVSWQAHLFGAVGGLLAAFLFRRRREPKAAPAPAA
ncbi:hypothetical protein BIV57_02645 [Mangrovactinospora gilvigrisea]|uniref:Peptidase S54 rhomboid domain-containing protein n=1 Tax=Mangrovactinospora gilvigrisea TaxID=1428644 RepID=A0A1J7BK18_9ACTN|nr:rhomboid family intramembrane serine protease [Mangrovactinospora gilvigrisea]OIV39023.1 hypothetical protein BIV57_02645 [Mangrovactinospora gilvigrisea]